MKSFLVTLITLAASVPLLCEPTPLNRWRSKNQRLNQINGVIDHYEGTDKDGRDDYELDRQIALICKNQVKGTVPLYKSFYSNGPKFFHVSDVNPIEMSVLIGYVYAEPPTEGSFKVYRLTKTNDNTTSTDWKTKNYLTTEVENEAKENGYVFEKVLFYSLPLLSEFALRVAPTPREQLLGLKSSPNSSWIKDPSTLKSIDDWRTDCIDTLNYYRNLWVDNMEGKQMNLLQWDTTLAQSAQNWADELASKNNLKRLPTIQNVFLQMHGRSNFSCARFTDVYYKMALNYWEFDPYNPYPSNLIPETTHVGCGVAIVDVDGKHKKKYEVCNFKVEKVKQKLINITNSILGGQIEYENPYFDMTTVNLAFEIAAS